MTDEKTKPQPLTVYQAIARVQAGLARDGISKDRKNEQQGYKFRGIDDIYNALARLLAEHGLCILPRVLAREATERTNKNGTALFYVVLDVEYDFVSAHDDTRHTVRVVGEAMDSGDKATNKAMSAAYKYACLQTFSIPTEGDNDADASTHEVVAKSPSPFRNAALRNAFFGNVVSSFDGAESLDGLADLVRLNKDNLDAMRESGSEHDRLTRDELLKRYEAARLRIQRATTVTASYGQGFADTPTGDGR